MVGEGEHSLRARASRPHRLDQARAGAGQAGGTPALPGGRPVPPVSEDRTAILED
jgi:hypothetical protein